MFVANTLIVVLVGSVEKLYPRLVILGRLLPWLGVALCVAWALITARQFGYYKYWFAWARHHEREMFGNAHGMTQCGRRFSDGLDVDVDGEQQRLKKLPQLFRVQWLVYAVIFIFVVVYIWLAVA